MDPKFYAVEPFPSYTDAPPNPYSQNPFNSNPFLLSQKMLQSRSNRSKSISSRIANYLRLRYYQYEVTFGLYVMSPGEKFVLNAFFLSIVLLMTWGLYSGLRPFVVRTFCRLLYYATGSLEGKEELCGAGAAKMGQDCSRITLGVMNSSSVEDANLFAL